MPEEHHLESLEDIQNNVTAVFKNISSSNIVIQLPVALQYHSIHSLPSYKSDIQLTSGNIHTNGAHNTNNNNTTTLMFIGLKKIQTAAEENSAGKDKELCSQTSVF
jgi:hypothetical protein